MISMLRKQFLVASVTLCVAQVAQADVGRTVDADEIAAKAHLLKTVAASDDAGMVGNASFKDSSGDGVTGKSLDDSVVPGGEAYQVNVPDKMANPWDAVVWSKLEGDIAKGDSVDMTFWARVVEGPGKVKALVQRNAEPYESVAAKEITLTAEWEEYTVTGNSELNLDSGEVGVAILIGYDAQTLEFGQFEVKKAKAAAEN